MLVCAGLLVIGAGCGKGSKDTAGKTEFEVDKVYERGPATVHVRLDKAKITIADTVLLQFEATLQPGYEMQMPKVDKLENFGLVDGNNLGKKLDDKNNVVTTYQYRLEPLLSGKYEIPAFKFQFHDANDPNSTHEVASEPVAVEVTSLLGDQRANLVIEDIESVVEMPKAASRWWLWLLLVLGVAAVPAAWLLLRRRRAKQLVRVFRPAHELAYARLRALVAENLVEQGKIPEFYERISGILRHYIEDRFDLHAPERTTEEFLEELRFTIRGEGVPPLRVAGIPSTSSGQALPAIRGRDALDTKEQGRDALATSRATLWSSARSWLGLRLLGRLLLGRREGGCVDDHLVLVHHLLEVVALDLFALLPEQLRRDLLLNLFEALLSLGLFLFDFDDLPAPVGLERFVQ